MRDLGDSLQYTSVHKRLFEGVCHEVLAENLELNTPELDKQIALDLPVWSAALAKNHPLCSMPEEFITATQRMHGRVGQRVYMSWDKQGEQGVYNASNTVFLKNPEHENGPASFHYRSDSTKYLDMFMAMHADFSILNPRSTFSWAIFTVRAGLNLDSVPRPSGKDLYLTKGYDRAPNHWVSWEDVLTARHRLYNN